MKQHFSADWLQWIQTNCSRGCDKEEIVRILLDHDFDPTAIVAAMRYVPQSADLIARMNATLGAELPAPEQSTAAAFLAIDNVKLPLARRLQTNKAHIYLFDDFLGQAECAAIIERIRARHQRSTTTVPGEPDRYFRTSQTCNLSQLGDPLVDALDRRIADCMGFEPERSEGIQGQFYQVGEEFKLHTDYFQPDSEEYRRYGGERGQRTWTFMVYLNNVEAGGETDFPHLLTTVTPKRGMAVIWNSLHADGSINANTLHCAKPVFRGEKFVITKWFRTHGSLRQPFKPLG